MKEVQQSTQLIEQAGRQVLASLLDAGIPTDLSTIVRSFKKGLVAESLNLNDGNQTAAAQQLNTTRHTIRVNTH